MQSYEFQAIKAVRFDALSQVNNKPDHSHEWPGFSTYEIMTNLWSFHNDSGTK